MGPLEAFAADTTKRALEALLGEIFEAGKGEFRQALKKWRSQKQLEKLRTRSLEIRTVKTIWQVEKEVDLLEFYYPSKVKQSAHKSREIHKIDELPHDGNIILRGTVGQGKSIFLRYLAARELSEGQRIPVFVELRRVRGSERLVNCVVDELKNLGLDDADESLVAFLAKAGKLVLLADGFDEIAEAQTARLVEELEALGRRYAALRILVTARPQTAIEHSARFRVFDLAPLTSTELPQVVRRLCENEATAKAIVEGVRTGHQSVAKLLSTPLMVALLVVHYRADQSIPENRVAFFKPLFMLLLQRHDRAKAGYVRERKSKLSDNKLNEFFNCFCFLARRDGLSILNRKAVAKLSSQAVLACNFQAEPEDVVHDIVTITCLMLHEGDEYRFVHKSVQEFHAACFVESQPDSLAREFYFGMQRKWMDWQQELMFLETIDDYRYSRDFAIPLLERTLAAPNADDHRAIGKALIARLSASVRLKPEVSFQRMVYPTDHVGFCLMHYLNGSLELFQLVASAAQRIGASKHEKDPHNEVIEIPFSELIEEIAPDTPALASAAETLSKRIKTAFDTRTAAVRVIEERKGLLDIV
jgi:hypothetical protein